MNKCITVFFLLFHLVIWCNTNGQSLSFKPISDKEEFISKFKEVTNQTITLKSDFIQEKHLSFLSDNIITKGKLFYKKPNMIRLEYGEPLNYLLIFKNNKVLIQEKRKTKQFDTSSNRIFRQINNMIIGSINGDILYDINFKVNYLENEKSFLLELVPLLKEVKAKIKIIRIYINRKDYTVSLFEITEDSGDYTQMQFMNQEMNTSIKEDIFIVK